MLKFGTFFLHCLCLFLKCGYLLRECSDLPSKRFDFAGWIGCPASLKAGSNNCPNNCGCNRGNDSYEKCTNHVLAFLLLVP